MNVEGASEGLDSDPPANEDLSGPGAPDNLLELTWERAKQEIIEVDGGESAYE